MNICGFLAVEVDAVWKASKFKGGLLFSLLILHLFFPSCSFLLIHNFFTDSSLPVIIVVASRGNYENQATVLEVGKSTCRDKKLDKRENARSASWQKTDDGVSQALDRGPMWFTAIWKNKYVKARDH